MVVPHVTVPNSIIFNKELSYSDKIVWITIKSISGNQPFAQANSGRDLAKKIDLNQGVVSRSLRVLQQKGLILVDGIDYFFYSTDWRTTNG